MSYLPVMYHGRIAVLRKRHDGERVYEDDNTLAVLHPNGTWPADEFKKLLDTIRPHLKGPLQWRMLDAANHEEYGFDYHFEHAHAVRDCKPHDAVEAFKQVAERIGPQGYFLDGELTCFFEQPCDHLQHWKLYINKSRVALYTLCSDYPNCQPPPVKWKHMLEVNLAPFYKPDGAPEATPTTAPNTGLPMSEVLAIVARNPSVKPRIQEIVQRDDYSDPQKMGAIQYLLREEAKNDAPAPATAPVPDRSGIEQSDEPTPEDGEPEAKRAKASGSWRDSNDFLCGNLGQSSPWTGKTFDDVYSNAPLGVWQWMLYKNGYASWFRQFVTYARARATDEGRHIERD